MPGLPNVIGAASSAVGPAELVSGMKSENRVGLAPAASGMATVPPTSRAPSAPTTARWRNSFVMLPFMPHRPYASMNGQWREW
jgi:hypothetical protein